MKNVFSRGQLTVPFAVLMAFSCASLALMMWVQRSALPNVHAQNLQATSACEAPVPNPLAVSTLRWYSRNQVAHFPMPGGILSVVFDGSNMYVLTNSPQSNSSTSAVIEKIRATDGALLATFTDFPSLEFSGFGRMLFDGEDLFVQFTASDDSGVLKFRASDGSPLGTFHMGTPGQSQPFGDMIFDGRDIWIVRVGVDVTRFRANNLQATGGIPGGDPQGLAFDGRSVWVTNLLGSVEVHRGSDGSLVHYFPMGGEPYAIAFDGANMWVTNVANNTLTKIRVHDFVELGTFPTQSGPNGILFDGANMWIENVGSHSVTLLRACDGTQVGVFATSGVPGPFAFDGINVWVAANGGFNKM